MFIQTEEREVYTYFRNSHGGLSYNSVTIVAKKLVSLKSKVLFLTYCFYSDFPARI